MASIRYFFATSKSAVKQDIAIETFISTLHWKSLYVVSSTFICRQWLFFWIYRAHFWTLYDTGKLLALLLLLLFIYFFFFYYLLSVLLLGKWSCCFFFVMFVRANQKSINQFINVTTWARVSPSIRAGGACIKPMTIIIINNNTTHDNNSKRLKMYRTNKY